MVSLLNYDLLAAFKDNFYADLLFEGNISQEIQFQKLILPDGTADENANFWGLLIEQEGKSFLLSEFDASGAKILDLKAEFPIKVLETEKVANGKDVYYNIIDYQSFKVRPDNVLGVRQLVDTLSSIPHSNPDLQKLNWFVALTSYIDRAYFRVSSNPGFGKDSAVEVLYSLVGDCSTLENPSLAKLEERAYSQRFLAFNEIITISPSAWKDMEIFLLAVAANKPRITKRTNAFGKIGQEINVSKFSLSLTYNDITNYQGDETKYFDSRATEQLQDRFLPLRFHGRFTENFDNVTDVNTDNWVEEKTPEYLDIIRTVLYYRDELAKHQSRYAIRGLVPLTQRWKLSAKKLLRIIDAYCESQEEFDKWVMLLNSSINDYLDMIQYNPMLQKLEKKIGVGAMDQHLLKVSDMPTFTKKLEYLKTVFDGKVPLTDGGLNNWDDGEIL